MNGYVSTSYTHIRTRKHWKGKKKRAYVCVYVCGKLTAAERAVKLREDEIITHTELPSDPFWQQSTGSLHADVQTFSKPGSALTFAVWGRHTQTVRGWRKKREKDLLTDNGEGTHQESPPQRSETLLWATMSQKQKKSLYMCTLRCVLRAGSNSNGSNSTQHCSVFLKPQEKNKKNLAHVTNISKTRR